MQSTSSLNIPTEVMRRFGGITNPKKQVLYSQHQSLGFVNIPTILKPQISNIDALLRFGVCEAADGTQGHTSYFVCPDMPSPAQIPFEEQPIYCCGPSSQQMCCTVTEFIAGIRVIRSDLLVSSSVVIGFSLGFLLLTAFLTIIVYSCLARGRRKLSTQLRCSNNSEPNLIDLDAKYAGSVRSSSNSSHVPPQQHLLSARPLEEIAATRLSKHKISRQKQTSTKSIRTSIAVTNPEQNTSKRVVSEPNEIKTTTPRKQSTITAVKMKK